MWPRAGGGEKAREGIGGGETRARAEVDKDPGRTPSGPSGAVAVLGNEAWSATARSPNRTRGKDSTSGRSGTKPSGRTGPSGAVVVPGGEAWSATATARSRGREAKIVPTDAAQLGKKVHAIADVQLGRARD